MLIVHHLNNSRSQRILWLLEELGLDYDLKSYQRDAETNLAPPELLQVHPLGKSPMIEDKGRLITESGAIVEYLCTRYGAHMIPAADSDDWISHQELMHFAEGSAMTPILLALYVGRLGAAGAPLGPRIEHQLDSHFNYMETVLRPSGHFVLDELSAVDIMMSFPAEVAVRQGRGDAHPKLAAFVAQIHARPGFERALERGGGYAFA
ncbi:glutathione S-transferase family protein [Sedimentitalea nanhaiensis]|uniref:glutathione transferase n=1 Tax=Sedimentitalea nanhaiensis TaxID=999627 RepID=A0A1I6ZWZ9_9RHOB|nr:glutathione S-transferase [Sedimentitalea nanhaiensis]SFT67209.1 glutathione S-transferase [Sedimentitalea nanhaiensis]